MEFKYQLTKVERATPSTIVNRCHIDKVDYVYSKLDRQHKTKLKNSCFGSLIRLPKFNGIQILHNMLMSQVSGDSKEIFWFKIGNKSCRFCLKEFTLITGLNVRNFEWSVSENKAKSCRIVKRYFKKKKSIHRKDVLEVFPSVADEEDKYKLGLLIILSYVLLAAEEYVCLEWWWFVLVDDLEAFNKFPWGSLCYEYTVRVFNRDLRKKFKEKKVLYTIYGFPHALMAWALESIPSLRSLVEFVDMDALPRMRKWTMPKRMTSSSVDALLQKAQEEDVLPTLVASNSEKSKPYYLALLDFHDSDVSEEEEGGEQEEGEEEGGEQDEGEQEGGGVNVEQTSVPQPSELEKAKDEILRVVKEENKLLRSELEDVRRKVDSLESIVKKVLFENVGGGEERKEGEGEGEGDFNEDEKRHEGGDVNEDEKRREVGEQSRCEGEKVLGKQKAQLEPAYPYFQNLKRRKLDTVLVFDPHREIEAEAMDLLETFMQFEEDSKNVRLVDGDVQASDLKEVVDGGWVTTPIMNAAFCEISLRQKAYPELFQQDARVLDTYFALLMKQFHEGMNKEVKLGNLSFDSKLLNYVRGENPVGGQPWSGCRYLYIPVSELDHWFLWKIDLQNRMIYVYDSLKIHIRMKTLQSRLMPLQCVIPFLLRKHVDGFQNYPLNKFSFERVKCPLQENGSDCGIFTIKFLEYLLANMNVDTIDRRHMRMWRRKLVAELLASQFAP